MLVGMISVPGSPAAFLTGALMRLNTVKRGYVTRPTCTKPEGAKEKKCNNDKFLLNHRIFRMLLIMINFYQSFLKSYFLRH